MNDERRRWEEFFSGETVRTQAYQEHTGRDRETEQNHGSHLAQMKLFLVRGALSTGTKPGPQGSQTEHASSNEK